MAKVELTNVSKVYENQVTAVKNANLTVEDQQFVVLVGPSGCGKSTLLRMIAGLEAISSGDLFIDGKRMNEVAPKDRDIAMVFQNYALYPHMTVFENMAFGLKLRKFPGEEIRARVEETAAILGLSEYLSRKPKALSGGQRQRVALGRAIVRKPKVFLFDEPLSNLDAKLRVQMRIEINRLHSRLQSTMIYVTHDQIEAMTMGDRIVVLKDGLIQQIDSPLNLYNHPANLFVAGFIGSPAMNLQKGRIPDGEGPAFLSGDLRLPLPENWWKPLKAYRGKEIILGVRPEHIVDSGSVTNGHFTEELNVHIDVIEPVGNEVFVYFEAGGANWCMRVPPDREYRPRQTLPVAMDARKLFFFDPETEQRIELQA